MAKSKDRVTISKDRVTKSKDRVTKPKLRRILGGRIEAQGGVGVAKPNVRRASGSSWGRFWEVQGPREISGSEYFFAFLGSKKSFPSSSVETGAE